MEDAVIAYVGRNSAAQPLRALSNETPYNLPSRGVYAKMGFVEDNSVWIAGASALKVPGHIQLC